MRHDKCDITCELTVIEPFPTPFNTNAKKLTPGTILPMHEWVTDRLGLPEQQVGWWWRWPYKWWLSLRAWNAARKEREQAEADAYNAATWRSS